MRILVAGDNRTMRWLVVQQLEKLGVDCDCAANGKEAVEWFKKRLEYDLILMDVMMPEVDGYQATREIREHEARLNARHTPIIAITCVDDEDSCLLAGMDDYTVKPISPEHVKELVRKWSRKTRCSPIFAESDGSALRAIRKKR